MGDTQQYNRAAGEGTQSYAVNVIRSLRWPGALTVSKSGKFTSIYIGYGLKRGASSYNPVEPPEVMADPDEVEEKGEPNPDKEPEVGNDPDTDNKEGDDE